MAVPCRCALQSPAQLHRRRIAGGGAPVTFPSGAFHSHVPSKPDPHPTGSKLACYGHKGVDRSGEAPVIAPPRHSMRSTQSALGLTAPQRGLLPAHRQSQSWWLNNCLPSLPRRSILPCSCITHWPASARDQFHIELQRRCASQAGGASACPPCSWALLSSLSPGASCNIIAVAINFQFRQLQRPSCSGVHMRYRMHSGKRSTGPRPHLYPRITCGARTVGHSFWRGLTL